MVKQARQRQALVNVAGAEIDSCFCKEFLGNHNERIDGLIILVDQLFEQLSKAPTLDQQVKIIQVRKGPIRKKIVEADEDLSFSIELLLIFHLHPKFESLRKFMEWIIEALSRRLAVREAEVVSSVAKVCKQVCAAFIDQRILSSIRNGGRANDCYRHLYSWTSALSCLSLIDKDIPWLGNATANEGEVSCLNSDLLEYLSLLADTCSACVVLFKEGGSSHDQAVLGECCGEVLRAIMVVLKSRRHLAVTIEQLNSSIGSSQSCKDIFSSICSSSLDCMNHPSARKDLVTASSMVYVCIQWLCRVVDTAAILDLNAALADRLRGVITNDSQDLHMLSWNGLRFASFGPLCRCALIRSIISVYHSDILWYHASTPEESLMIGPLFHEILSSCNNNFPEVRLYSLQTLETWFNVILDNIRSKSGPQVEGLWKILHDCMIKVSTLLCAVWAHPTKQVNHMVPTVYSYLVEVVDAIVSNSEMDSSDNIWKPFLMDALSQPPQHRGRYQAMTCLLPKVGAHCFLRLDSNIVQILIEALTIRDAASSACSMLSQLLKSIKPVNQVNTQPSAAKEATKKRKRNTGDNSEANASTVVAVEVVEQSSNNTDEGLMIWRDLWIGQMSKLLLDADPKRCVTVADYMIPEMIKMDPQSVPFIISHLRKVAYGDASNFTLDRLLWAVCSIALHARLNGVDAGAITAAATTADGSTSDRFTTIDLEQACKSYNIELRLLALNVIAASQKKTAPICPIELQILQQTLRYSLKSSQADHRQNTIRGIKCILLRLSECARIGCRDAQKATVRLVGFEKKLSEAVGAVDQDASKQQQQIFNLNKTIDELKASIEVSNEAIVTFNNFNNWFCSELLSGLYPGTTSDREIMCLDLFSATIEMLSSQSMELQQQFLQQQTHLQSKADSVSADGELVQSSSTTTTICIDIFSETLHNIYLTESSTKTLINLVVRSSWDRTRHMAAELLASLPGLGFPGYDDVKSVNSLLKWSYFLIGSARQRESDAGALLLKNVFAKYCQNENWEVMQRLYETCEDNESITCQLCPFFQESSIKSKQQNESKFMQHLSDVFENRLKEVDEMFNFVVSLNNGASVADCNSDVNSFQEQPLVHGTILAIKYCLSSINSFQDIKCEKKGHNVLNRLLQLALRSLNYAMKVVAEAKSEEQTAHYRESNGSGSVSSRGPVQSHTNTHTNTHTSMAATYVNTNSNMGHVSSGNAASKGLDDATAMCTDAANEDQFDDHEGSALGPIFQRAVVAAWLIVKEACALIAMIIEKTPVPLTQNEILSVDEIREATYLIFDALGRLKHMGAISEAQNALQLISQRLLRLGDQCIDLCQLPMTLLLEALGRLDNEDQVFILRRSAGFAFTFLSLLRAEVANKCVPTLLPVAMRKMLETVELGLEDSFRLAKSVYRGTDAAVLNANSERKQSGSWRMGVHALNVIRLIILDASLATQLDTYISQAIMLAVKGFSSTHWAVRNSCMMVFSSTVQRVVDNDKQDSGGVKASTISEFFIRFPDLLSFLVNELKLCVQFCATDSDVATAAAQGSDLGTLDNLLNCGSSVHPSLFPILLLLSKLRASFANSTGTEVGGSEASRHIASFGQLVESCLSFKLQKVREMASKAFVSLTSVCDIFSRVMYLNGVICKDLNSGKINYNRLHGYLLAVFELLESSRRHIGSWVDFSAFDKSQEEQEQQHDQELNSAASEAISDTFILKLRDLFVPLFLGTVDRLSEVVCPGLHRVVLKILVTIRGLLSTTQTAGAASVDDLLRFECDSVLYCLQGIINESGAVQLSRSVNGTANPFLPLLLKESVSEYTFQQLKLSFGANNSRSHQLIAFAEHTTSEVREGFVIGVNQFLDDSSSESRIPLAADFLSRTLQALIGLCKREEKPIVLTTSLELACRVLQAMKTNRLPLQPLSDSDWMHLVSIVTLSPGQRAATTDDIPRDMLPVDSAMPTAACAAALQLLGFLLELPHQWSVLSESGQSSLCKQVSIWARMLLAASNQDQIDDVRLGAARSIASSGIIAFIAQSISTANISCNGLAQFMSPAVSVLRIILTLLQDDDEDIREEAALAVLAYQPKSDSMEVVDVSLRQMLVQELAMESVGSLIGQCAAIGVKGGNLEAISSVLDLWRESLGSVAPIYEMINNQLKLNSSSKKIFDAEQPNLYFERVVAIRMFWHAVMESQRFERQEASWSAAWGTLWPHLKDSLNLLKDVIISRPAFYIDAFPTGVSFEKDVFAFIYGSLSAANSLLALHDQSCTILRSQPLAAEMNEAVVLTQSLLQEEATRSTLHSWIGTALINIADLLVQVVSA